MSLNQFSTIGIYRDTHRFAWFRRATFHDGRAMNKNVAALLGVGHPQPTDLGPIVSRHVKHSSITDLSAHLGIERRAIENNVHLTRLFARQDSVDDRFRLEKIVPEEFGRLDFELAFFNTDFFFLLCLARALALLLH